MRWFWEQIGMLGPIYRLLGKGMSNFDIAEKLGVTNVNVEGCSAWMLRLLKFTSREELVQYASSAA